MVVHPVVAAIARVGVASLLDRRVDEWVAALRAANTTVMATGSLRYSWRHPEAVVGGDEVKGGYARDCWAAPPRGGCSRPETLDPEPERD